MTQVTASRMYFCPNRQDFTVVQAEDHRCQEGPRVAQEEDGCSQEKVQVGHEGPAGE